MDVSAVYAIRAYTPEDETIYRWCNKSDHSTTIPVLYINIRNSHFQTQITVIDWTAARIQLRCGWYNLVWFLDPTCAHCSPILKIEYNQMMNMFWIPWIIDQLQKMWTLGGAYISLTTNGPQYALYNIVDDGRTV